MRIATAPWSSNLIQRFRFSANKRRLFDLQLSPMLEISEWQHLNSLLCPDCESNKQKGNYHSECQYAG